MNIIAGTNKNRDTCFLQVSLLAIGKTDKILLFAPYLIGLNNNYSSGHTKCAFPASRPSIRIFCPVQKRFVTVIK